VPQAIRVGPLRSRQQNCSNNSHCSPNLNLVLAIFTSAVESAKNSERGIRTNTSVLAGRNPREPVFEIYSPEDEGVMARGGGGGGP